MQVFTPDELRGSYATVEQAVNNNKWPLLDEMLGKVCALLPFFLFGPVVMVFWA